MINQTKLERLKAEMDAARKAARVAEDAADAAWVAAGAARALLGQARAAWRSGMRRVRNDRSN